MSSLAQARDVKKSAVPKSAKGRRAAEPSAVRQESKSAAKGVSPEERYAMIARMAYLRAADRGFAPGNELDDWLAAEVEFEVRLSSR